MSEIIFLNGEFLALKNAKIPINDRGFLLGDGLFETIRFDRGIAFKFDAHWSRLQSGCNILNIPLSLNSGGEALEAIQTLLTRNQLINKIASVRLTLTRGPGQRGLTPPESPQPLMMIQCAAIPEQKTASISVMESSIIVNERSPQRHFKSLSYTDNIIARQQAITAGYDDALLYNTQGFLVSATCANIFLVINDELITPPTSTGALPGVMRQHVLDTAPTLGIKIAEKNLQPEDCKQAQEAFLTNSLIRLRPIRRLNGLKLTPGKIYNQLISNQ